MKKQIEKLQVLARKLRFTGLLCLIFTGGNLAALAFSFAIYFFNNRIFRDPISNSFRAEDLGTRFGAILFWSFVIFMSCFVALYRFEQLKKSVNILADEIFDEIGWYSNKVRSESSVNTHSERNIIDFDSDRNKIDIEDRIAIKTASESTNLPFLSTNQSAAIYVLFNLILYFMVSITDLYLIQLLNYH